MEGGRLLSAVSASIARTPSPHPPPPHASSLTAFDPPPPLSLKVMRLSRPTLAHVPAHYFEATAPSSSSTASDTLSNALLARVDGSLLHYGLSQDPSAAAAAVDGGSAFHPATMRDFPLSALPTLPGSFGTISLGETFSAALCLSNDSAADVSHVRLRAEMQTASTKTLLSEVRGPDETGGGIDRGQALPLTVKWEIKELGLHILACEIFWFDDEAQGERSFRKVYKFQVINPLSVKTKIHVPHSATAALSPAARNLLFLELHVQNTSPLPMTFSKMSFAPADGLTFRSMNAADIADGLDVWEDEGGQGPVLLPGDVRQVCWIVDETDRPGATSAGGLKKVWEPGTVLPLGKMDIYWSTPYGETGHLQTSTLNRRVPLPPPPPHDAAPVLHRNPSSASGPVPTHSLPSSPAANPKSLTLNRADSLSNLNAQRPRRVQDLEGPTTRRSGVMSLPPTPPPKDVNAPADAPGLPEEPPAWEGEEWDVDLMVIERPTRAAGAGKPAQIEEVFQVRLRVAFKLREVGPAPPDGLAERTFELQHAAPATASALQPMGSSIAVFAMPIAGATDVATKEWTLEYFPLRAGLVDLAGLRIVAVGGAAGDAAARQEKEVGAWDSLGEVAVRW